RPRRFGLYAPPSPKRAAVRRSGQAGLRHTRGPAESCCLPALTRFTGSRCAGPGRYAERRSYGSTTVASRPEGCESGRIGTPGVRVSRKGPWVQIPLPPPLLAVLAVDTRPTDHYPPPERAGRE